MDREKVIKALEFCTSQKVVDTCYGECPYAVADDDYRCLEMKQDALALLKEQEAVQPETKPSTRGIYTYVCGVCGWSLYEVRDTVHFDGRKLIHFCPYCGTPVKWD